MSFAANELKIMYVNRTPKSNKAIHIVSSAYKATLTWNNMRTLQVSITIILGLIENVSLASLGFYYCMK